MVSPSIALLKRGDLHPSEMHLLINALANWRADKGYAREALDYWLRKQRQQSQIRALSTLVGRFLMRTPYDATSLWLHQALAASLYSEPVPTYGGTSQENLEIDRAIAESEDSSGYRDRIGRGSARFFSLEGFRIPQWAGRQTPIVILGAGAAGILVARTLTNAGYTNIRVLDATNEYGGIWKRENVQFSRNNPFPFTYEDFRVEAAPGTGLVITSFLEQLAHPPTQTGMKPLPRVLQGTILRVEPGDLSHRVVYRSGSSWGSTQEVIAPIVINALGLGEPLPLSRLGIIETDVPDHKGGIRWQHQISPLEANCLRDKRIVFIGLGNSTMEMVVQLQKWNRAGYNIHYKILTHLSHEALMWPQYPDANGRQLYRSPADSRLTQLAGDLEYIDSALQQARESDDPEHEQIIPSVCHWNIEEAGDEQTMVVKIQGRNEMSTQRFRFDRLYTLIGYSHPPSHLRDMGLTLFSETIPTRVAHDYDGEFQRQPAVFGRDRLHPGYFGLGALLWAPNSQVIPGMLYRLPDLLVGVALRATEYMLRGRTLANRPEKHPHRSHLDVHSRS